VAVAAAVAYRQRLRLTREIVAAGVRAGVQLIAVSAVLLVLFRRAGLPGAAGWVTVMILIAGQVAGHRGIGAPRARTAATVGVAAGTVVTLGALLAAGVIAPQAPVIVPVGGMIVAAGMQAAGIALRRLREDAQNARPVIETRLCLGQSSAGFLCGTTVPEPACRACRTARPRDHHQTGRSTNSAATAPNGLSAWELAG
jgi:putative ABC transport system permease protein